MRGKGQSRYMGKASRKLVGTFSILAWRPDLRQKLGRIGLETGGDGSSVHPARLKFSAET
ncbi:hypothetical protein NOR_07284 [Metarhizium rileyi]|uniref:Uncharacterized protein n=1 Tax=Metarhizium rileyi (strain RCEF 4871) TaxID=1649241 RepID=A0A166YKN3_METRR|nr:hypothetical protein NOR_07284 [Metarhizium rileyi RCEF 4871]